MCSASEHCSAADPCQVQRGRGKHHQLQQSGHKWRRHISVVRALLNCPDAAGVTRWVQEGPLCRLPQRQRRWKRSDEALMVSLKGFVRGKRRVFFETAFCSKLSCVRSQSTRKLRIRMQDVECAQWVRGAALQQGIRHLSRHKSSRLHESNHCVRALAFSRRRVLLFLSPAVTPYFSLFACPTPRRPTCSASLQRAQQKYGNVLLTDSQEHHFRLG